MRFPRACVVALTVLLVAAASVGVVAATAPPDHSARGQSTLEQSTLLLQDDDDDDDDQLRPADPKQVIRINITASGDARWTIESRFLIEDAEDEEAFQAYAASVANGERDAGYDASSYEQFVDASSEATGREMALVDAGYDEPRIDDVNRTGPMGGQSTDRVGVVAYSFTWESFATTEGSEISVGDAFESPDGSWFPALNADQRLVVDIPSNSTLKPGSTPEGHSWGEDGGIVWDGPIEFVENDDVDREFDVVLGESSGNGPGGPGGETPPSEPPEDTWSAGTVLLGGAALALLTVAVVGGYLVTQRSSSGSGSGSTPAWLPASVRDRLEDDDPNVRDPAAAPIAAPPDAPVEEPDDAGGVDPDLLSDEERVLRLLRGNGGRMKQASIVKETGWSNAKVSQLLSKMDDDDEIEKLRIGRENLITLPEIDPTELD